MDTYSSEVLDALSLAPKITELIEPDPEISLTELKGLGCRYDEVVGTSKHLSDFAIRYR